MVDEVVKEVGWVTPRNLVLRYLVEHRHTIQATYEYDDQRVKSVVIRKKDPRPRAQS